MRAHSSSLPAHKHPLRLVSSQETSGQELHSGISTLERKMLLLSEPESNCTILQYLHVHVPTHTVYKRPLTLLTQNEMQGTS